MFGHHHKDRKVDKLTISLDCFNESPNNDEIRFWSISQSRLCACVCVCLCGCVCVCMCLYSTKSQSIALAPWGRILSGVKKKYKDLQIKSHTCSIIVLIKAMWGSENISRIWYYYVIVRVGCGLFDSVIGLRVFFSILGQFFITLAILSMPSWKILGHIFYSLFFWGVKYC